jgi:hypothetical protein
VKLTVGTESASTYAQVTLNSVPKAAPVSAPSFTTDNYAAGSPRWVINFSNGCYLFGYPAQVGGGATATFTGAQWEVNGTCASSHGEYETYAQALNDVSPANSATVTSAYIVADGDQTAGTTDTITAIQYNGEGVAPQVTSHPTPPGHGQPTQPGHGHPTQPGHGHPTQPGHGHPTQPTGHSNHGYVVNSYSGKCLDARNTFGRARTTRLQLWSCGAANGEDQVFTYTDHSLRYDARNGNDRYCVSEPRTGDQAMLIAPCDNARSQYVTYDNGRYKYRDGRVLDDKSFGTSDGNPVLVFANNGGANQRWSLPK